MDDAEASIIASNTGAYGKTVDIWIGLHDPEEVWSMHLIDTKLVFVETKQSRVPRHQ